MAKQIKLNNDVKAQEAAIKDLKSELGIDDLDIQDIDNDNYFDDNDEWDC